MTIAAPSSSIARSRVAARRARTAPVPIALAGFLGVLALGGAGMVAGILDGAVGRAQGDWWRGDWTLSLEDELARSTPLRDAVLPVLTAADTALFREGRSGVVLGPGDWLFTEEEIAPSVPGALEANLATIAAVADRLAARGIPLVVALLPDKLRILSPALPGLGYPAYHQARYATIRGALEGLGIAAPDLIAPLAAIDGGRGAFMRHDTHWTPAGAAAVASAIADAAGGAGQATLGQTHLRTNVAPPTAHEGDLMRFLPLGPFAPILGFAPERVAVPSTVRVAAAVDEAALFGETEAPAALVGTSYSAMPEWNFAGALGEALGAPVENFAARGEGPIEPMLLALEDLTAGESPPRLVVWEMPERYLDDPQPTLPADDTETEPGEQP